MNRHPWLLASRPRTLPAAIAPVVAGSAIAYNQGSFQWAPALACLFFALLVQIGTNFANDYYDWKQGADTRERTGPTRAVAGGLIRPASMLVGTVVVFTLAFAFGLLLIPWGGWWLILLGLASIFSAIAYTAKPFAFGYRGLGDVFVILFFGFIAVGATTWLQTGSLPFPVWVVGASIGLLANNLLVINNYRDRESDGRVGKRTLIVRWGRTFGEREVLAGFVIAALTAVLLTADGTSRAAWIALAGLFPVYQAWRGMPAANTPPEYGKLLQQSSLGLTAYSLLLSLGLCLGA